MDWIVDQIINLLLTLDTVVYGINVLLFDLFMAVARARFSKTIYDNFLNNIYVIIGIFMIFRVAFSLIQMLANPDMIADKEKGVGKIASRIVICFALIIMVPTIFDLAYSLQDAIIEDNLIPQLILGKENASTTINNHGKKMSIDVFKGMLNISPELNNSNDPKVTACNLAIKDPAYSTIGSLKQVSSSGGKVNCFTDKISVGGSNIRIYDYKMLVSTIATGMVAWLMVGFCIDVSLRLIKLMFLQLIAPVCIVTYVGGGKDNSFNKWMKMTISSYVNVFVKIIVIYFIIYLASQVSTNLKALGLTNVPLGQVAVILGLLVFAKNAPKLIGDLFGVKMDEESGFKGIAKTALLGGAALAAGGGVAGLSNLAKGVGNIGKNVKEAGNGNFWKGLGTGKGWGAVGKGILGAAGSTIAGTTAGAFYGAKNGFGKNATLGGSINKALMTSRTNREARADRKSVYGGAGGIKGSLNTAWRNLVADRVLGFAGIDTGAKKVANQHKNIGAGLQRAKSNVLSMQNNYAEAHSLDVGELSNYSYNAFDDQWSYYDSGANKMITYDKGVDIGAARAGLSGDELEYLKYTKQDANLEKRIIENNKALGKAETQQKKMEGSNGSN